MKKSVGSLVALIAVSTLACGGASDAPAPLQGPDGGVATMPSGTQNPSSPDGGPVLPGQDPRPPSSADGGGPPPVPPPPPTKPNEITEQFGVFVSTEGQANASGTRAAPLASIEAAIARAKNENKKKVFVCEGSYAEALTLADGVSIEGRLDCATPDWKLDTSKHVNLASPSSPAIRATNITSATRIDGFQVTAPDATEPSGSSIAVIAVDSNGLTFAGGSLAAGSAMRGADGTDGMQLKMWIAVGAGRGDEWATAPAVAFEQRQGGSGQVAACLRPDDSVFAQMVGASGDGSGFFTRASRNDPWATLNARSRGAAPVPSGATTQGVDGTSALAGILGAEGYTPGDGADGTAGSVGRSGKGGAPDELPPPNVIEYGKTYGRSGAGGGAGGCPGLPGTAGKGGGASIALLAIRSPVRLDKVDVSTASGGAGGRGTFGSQPAPGTAGGYDGAAMMYSSPGEGGGRSGVSGNGAGGPSLAIAYQGGAPVLTQANTTVGAGGAGIEARSQNGKTIPASPAGVSLATQAF